MSNSLRKLKKNVTGRRVKTAEESYKEGFHNGKAKGIELGFEIAKEQIGARVKNIKKIKGIGEERYQQILKCLGFVEK